MTVMFSFLLGVSRIWFSMSRDGLLPGGSPRRKQSAACPSGSTWIAGIASAVIAGLLPSAVADLTNIGILAAFVVVCVAVIVLRRTKPDAPREFRLPLMPVVPAFGVLASVFLISQLHWETWLRFVIWLIIGLIIYFTYGRHHSLMNPDSPRNAEAEPAGR